MAPIPRSRAEIRLVRLLARCEEIASSDPPSDWRLEKNVQELEERLSKVETLGASEKPNEESLKEYAKKVEFLKNLLAVRSIAADSSEKSLANQMLVPGKTKTIPSKQSSVTGQQIQMKVASRYESDMREELMARKDEGNDVRYRGDAAGSNLDDNEILKRQQKLHEQIADEMVALTRNLKHNVQASNAVIKKDLDSLSKANHLIDSNLGNLQNESSRIEGHLKKGTNWWLWISLAIVCAVFLFMIFFIRFFPKK